MVALKTTFAYKTATLRHDRFYFNQVVYEEQATPERVVLIGWDDDRGAYIWTLPGDVAAAHAATQAANYSLALPNVNPDAPPPWLGDPDLLTKDEIAAADGWPDLEGLAPHPKRQAILAAVSKLRPDLFDSPRGKRG